MCRLCVAMLLASVAAPALAAPRHAEEREAARVADRLNDPATQGAVSGMMVAFADMLMEVRIDKLRAAIARVDPDADDTPDRDDARTIGDMVARDDPYFRERLAHGSRQAVAAMGTAAVGIADMTTELRDMGERMGREMDKATKRLPRD